MRSFAKRLVAVATAGGLTAVLGAAWAQSAQQTITTNSDPETTVEVKGDAQSGNQIYFFRDQGNSPETDPAAHLLLIKHEAALQPVAMESSTTTTTTETPPPAPAPEEVAEAPAPAPDTSTAAPAEDETPAPMPAPKAARN